MARAKLRATPKHRFPPATPGAREGVLAHYPALRAPGEEILDSVFVACHAPVRGVPRAALEAVRMERGRASGLPRLLLDPAKLADHPPSAKRLARDADRLARLVARRPEAFEALAAARDPAEFERAARRLGLTEEAFAKDKGGLIEWLILLAAAVALTGCSDAPATPVVAKCSPKLVMDPGPNGLVVGGAVVSATVTIDAKFRATSNLHGVGPVSLHDAFIAQGKSWDTASKTFKAMVGQKAIPELTKGPKVKVDGCGGNPGWLTVEIASDALHAQGCEIYPEVWYACPTCGAEAKEFFTIKVQ